MSDTIHETVHVTSLAEPGEAHINPAVPFLVERLNQQRERYTQACGDGRRGYANFLLDRMASTSKRILEILDGEWPCCHPYRTARHTAVCATVTHAPHPFADSDSGLTGCGMIGPIDEVAPTCDSCTGARAKEGWEDYPDQLGPLTAWQYGVALEEARDWLADCEIPVPTETSRVWRYVNANYDGGLAAFVQATEPLWAA